MQRKKKSHVKFDTGDRKGEGEGGGGDKEDLSHSSFTL